MAESFYSSGNWRVDRGDESDQRVFLMMRFRDGQWYEELADVINITLEEYGLKLVRADLRQVHDELWANLCQYMNSAHYGIAVFEQFESVAPSPNVSLELGYLLARGKRCLLLKERRVPLLQADLVGHLYREFDADDVQGTVAAAVRAWLVDIGIAKKQNDRLLIFVSHGGTCRDPLAKAAMQYLMETRPPPYHLRVEAKALGPPSRPTVSLSARRAIKKRYGFDLIADHNPARITRRLIEDADLILVMAQSLLGKNLPTDKTYNVRPFFGLSGDIEDPWPDMEDEQSLQDYLDCLDELHGLLERNYDNLIDWLKNH